jgi:hypothetical protein
MIKHDDGGHVCLRESQHQDMRRETLEPTKRTVNDNKIPRRSCWVSAVITSRAGLCDTTTSSQAWQLLG